MISAIAYLVLFQAKPKPAPAIFSDASTRRIVELSRKAFDNLTSAKLTITSGTELKKYTFSGGKLAGHQKGAQWAWAQKRLVLQCSKGLFRGSMGAYNVNPWLTKVGAQPEILPIQLAMKKNPVTALVAPGSRVRKAGTMSLNGVAVDMIEIKTNSLRVTMTIRQDNRLLADVRAVSVDSDGRVLFSSTRTFLWSSVNKPISGREFALGSGKASKPIRSLI